jgi:error-prone DNA polymerase
MMERTDDGWFCNVCSHDWPRAQRLSPNQGRGGSRTAPTRFSSLDDLIARTGLRRDEVVTLADLGALNAFGYDRRSALWQAERAVRPSGELFALLNAEPAEHAEIFFENESSTLSALAKPKLVSIDASEGWSSAFERDPETASPPSSLAHDRRSFGPSTGSGPSRAPSRDGEAGSAAPSPDCPLKPMTEMERLVADYAGMGLSAGRHPMALKRDELAMRGILRARDLTSARQGRRVRVAGMVITRQRPGTAKGFVFLTLEDETGIANIIVRPDLFARDRLVIVEEPFLIVDGVLQNQDGVTSIRAEQVQGMKGVDVDFDAHDFY